MSELIRRPSLPPRNGFVEVVDPNGNHIYEATPEELRRISIEKENEELKSDAKLKDAQIGALSTQHDFLEECLVEMATLLYP